MLSRQVARARRAPILHPVIWKVGAGGALVLAAVVLTAVVLAAVVLAAVVLAAVVLAARASACSRGTSPRHDGYAVPQRHAVPRPRAFAASAHPPAC